MCNMCYACNTLKEKQLLDASCFISIISFKNPAYPCAPDRGVLMRISLPIYKDTWILLTLTNGFSFLLIGPPKGAPFSNAH